MASEQIVPSPPSELDVKYGTNEFVEPSFPVDEELDFTNGSVNDHKTFLQTDGVESYIPIEKYEGRHRWDPKFQWGPDEEKKILRKIDLRICSWVCLAFFALQLDRANVIQALTDNMLVDLGMTTNEYNYGMTM